MGANIGERLMEEEADMFPMELMGSLPDLEYVASFAGGKLMKGRIPILGEPK
jgi:conjugal transfer pilus assembly protein TraD